MDNDSCPARDPGDREPRECPMHREGHRTVRIPIAQPPDDTRIDRVGRSPLIAAIAAVIRDAMDADASSGVSSLPPGDDDGD